MYQADALLSVEERSQQIWDVVTEALSTISAEEIPISKFIEMGERWMYAKV